MAGAKRFIYGMGIAPGDEVKLRSDLILRPIEFNDDIDWLRSKSRSQFDFGLLCAYSSRVSFELEIRADNDRAASAKAWNAQWDLILLAILRATPVHWAFQSATHHNRDDTNKTQVMGNAINGGNAFADPVAFSLKDFDAYRELQEPFHGLLKRDRFTHAASVAALNYNEPKPSIRMAGIWSAIEALLGFDHELRFRIALAVARLLHKDEQSRAKRFAETKKLYDLRSKSVHGASVKHDDVRRAAEQSLKLLCELVIEFTRRGEVLTPKEADQLFLENS